MNKAPIHVKNVYRAENSNEIETTSGISASSLYFDKARYIVLFACWVNAISVDVT